MMKVPLRPGTRPVGAAQLAVEDTSTDGPVFAATPEGDGARPQDRRGGVRVRGARRVHVSAMVENILPE